MRSRARGGDWSGLYRLQKGDRACTLSTLNAVKAVASVRRPAPVGQFRRSGEGHGLPPSNALAVGCALASVLRGRSNRL